MNSIPPDLLREANREHWTRGVVRPSDAAVGRVAIVDGGAVVGFYTPGRAFGAARIGPVYVRPQWRRRGLVLAVYASIGGPMVACIEDGNEASRRLHARAGFAEWRRYARGWWWRRDA